MCLAEYNNCFGITYNTSTEACTPNVSNIISPGQELFYHIRVCNEAMGFQLYTSGSLAQCFYISNEVINFTSAREICEARNSRMFMVKSSEKLDLLRLMVRTITQSQTWVGLTDIATEGNFVWADGESTANVSLPIPWDEGQPDDADNEEDCVEMGKSSVDFINDLQCYKTSRFICEAELSAY
ncbi:unnamed protein product [Candidula unifasciata]|uniref:C-type lectin domain-containing protein n=1 Tax=Candidula unifasciata TaxID=100452 RepID=A0A8S4A6R3_9EUPU|nr:unnamed protein product [Candidula unifasciata]